MARMELLKKQQIRLKDDISNRLENFLIGTVAKSPAMSGYGLTTKVNGKTVSLYVRKGVASQAQEMTGEYAKLWSRIQKLSKINWKILKLSSS